LTDRISHLGNKIASRDLPSGKTPQQDECRG
jgi:hypothetical protein